MSNKKKYTMTEDLLNRFLVVKNTYKGEKLGNGFLTLGRHDEVVCRYDNDNNLTIVEKNNDKYCDKEEYKKIIRFLYNHNKGLVTEF